MIFNVKSINTVDNAGKQVDGMKRPREPPTGGNRMDIGRILPTEAAAILNVSPQFVRVAMQQGKLPIGTAVQMSSIWTYHISEKLLVMDGALDMETVESCWKQSSRNEVRRLQTDENGLSGMANYIVEEKNRVPSEKRWNSSQGLRDPRIKVVYSKRPAAGGSYKKIGSFVDKMVKDRDSIPEILKKWYPDMDFTNAAVYYNDFNCMFYIQIAYILRYKLQRFTWMFKVKDCRHVCLFCEYYDTCRQEGCCGILKL